MLKKLAMGIAGLVAIMVAGAYLLPREITLERSIAINAPAARIFPFINSLRRTNQWAIWLKRDPQARVTYSGPQTGVGAKVQWVSQVREVGSGAQKIVESIKDSKVATKLDFGAQGTASARLTLKPNGVMTKVIWTFYTDLGLNPIARYFGLIIDDLIANDYDLGLSELKRQVEAL